MEYCCVGVIFLLAICFAVLGLVFGLQYRSRTKTARTEKPPAVDEEEFHD
jgi:hypothetical protein